MGKGVASPIVRVIRVGTGIPLVGSTVALPQPVVTVTVCVGITHRVIQPVQEAVTVWVGVTGQQAFLFWETKFC